MSKYIPLLLFLGFIAASCLLLYAIWVYIKDDHSGKAKKSGPAREAAVDWNHAEGPMLLCSDGREFLLSPADQELLKTGAAIPSQIEQQYFTDEAVLKLK